MGLISNSMLRTLFSLVIGVVLIVWPEAAGIYLVILIGALFTIPALISIVGYLTHRSNKETGLEVTFPLLSLGSLLFGAWLMVNPAFFVAILMYLLGALLVLSGISLIVKLISFHRVLKVHPGFFVLPSLLILVGLLVLYNPFEVATIPFILLGISCICYAISNTINDLKFRRQEAKIIEEITEPATDSGDEALEVVEETKNTED